MVNRLAKRIGAVMATGTATSNGRTGSGVIESPCCPGCCRGMTVIALRRRADVRTGLGLRILWQVTTAVTTGALPIEVRVIHLGR